MTYISDLLRRRQFRHQEQFQQQPAVCAEVGRILERFCEAEAICLDGDMIAATFDFLRDRTPGVAEAISAVLFENMPVGSSILVDFPSDLHLVLGIEERGSIAAGVTRNKEDLEIILLEQESGSVLPALVSGHIGFGTKNAERIACDILGMSKENNPVKGETFASLYGVRRQMREAINGGGVTPAEGMLLFQAERGLNLQIFPRVLVVALTTIAARQLGLTRDWGRYVLPLGGQERLIRALRGCFLPQIPDGIIAHATHATLQ